MKTCSYCGEKIKRKMSFCPRCGQKIIFVDSFGMDEPCNYSSDFPKKERRKITIFIVVSVLIFLLIIAESWYYIYVFYRNNNNTDVVAETLEIVEILLPQKDFSEDPERISAASNSVVMLTCYDKQGNEYCTGSGFSLFEDGIIITNYHVIQDNVYRIVGQTEQNQSFEIDQIIAYDAKKDIAILKSSNSIELNDPPNPPAKLGRLEEGVPGM